jgi:hypothetical protein
VAEESEEVQMMTVFRITGWVTVCAAVMSLALGGASAAIASGDSRAVVPPDRSDRLGVQAVNGGRPVQLSPDRADGLGSARLPTMPTPIVIVRTEPGSGFDWLASGIGAAIAIAAVLVVVAARMVRQDAAIAKRS